MQGLWENRLDSLENKPGWLANRQGLWESMLGFWVDALDWSENMRGLSASRQGLWENKLDLWESMPDWWGSRLGWWVNTLGLWENKLQPSCKLRINNEERLAHSNSFICQNQAPQVIFVMGCAFIPMR